MNKKQGLIIAIATFITVIAWVVFDILHTRTQTEISPELTEVIEPLDPNFDLSALDNLP